MRFHLHIGHNGLVGRAGVLNGILYRLGHAVQIEYRMIQLYKETFPPAV
jgi:hypothetical protein